MHSRSAICSLLRLKCTFRFVNICDAFTLTLLWRRQRWWRGDGCCCRWHYYYYCMRLVDSLFRCNSSFADFIEWVYVFVPRPKPTICRKLDVFHWMVNRENRIFALAHHRRNIRCASNNIKALVSFRYFPFHHLVRLRDSSYIFAWPR